MAGYFKVLINLHLALSFVNHTCIDIPPETEVDYSVFAFLISMIRHSKSIESRFRIALPSSSILHSHRNMNVEIIRVNSIADGKT